MRDVKLGIKKDPTRGANDEAKHGIDMVENKTRNQALKRMQHVALMMKANMALIWQKNKTLPWMQNMSLHRNKNMV